MPCTSARFSPPSSCMRFPSLSLGNSHLTSQISHLGPLPVSTGSPRLMAAGVWACQSPLSLKSHILVLFLCSQGPEARGHWGLGLLVASQSPHCTSDLLLFSAFAVIMVEAGSYSQWLWGEFLEFLGRQHPLCLLHPPLLCFAASVTLFSEACVHTSAREIFL